MGLLMSLTLAALILAPLSGSATVIQTTTQALHDDTSRNSATVSHPEQDAALNGTHDKAAQPVFSQTVMVWRDHQTGKLNALTLSPEQESQLGGTP